LIERIFDAPRERVRQAWTVAEQLKRWWGPKEFTAPYAKIDLRVGEKYLFSMRSPEGKEYWSIGVYHEIVPMAKIVATDNFSNEKGNIVPPSLYGMNGDWPEELRVTVIFEEEPSGKTKMTLRHVGIPEGENREGARQGWNQSFGKLAESLR
jgi:uncharacterized protein YndB with AHSA1/START domain